MLEMKFRKSFGNKQVLSGVDLTAQQGHILGLVGKMRRENYFPQALRFLTTAARACLR